MDDLSLEPQFALSVIVTMDFKAKNDLTIIQGTKGILYKRKRKYSFITEKCPCCGYQLEVFAIPKSQTLKLFKLI